MTSAYGPDSAEHLCSSTKVVDIPVLVFRSGSASDSVIDRAQ